jgi:hypothetical protein
MLYSDISDEGSNEILKLEVNCLNKNYGDDRVSNKFDGEVSIFGEFILDAPR